mgnify:CR=1 FL=1
MKNSEKILKSISSLIENGILTSKDIKEEISTDLKFKKDKIINKLELISREEFEVLKKVDSHKRKNKKQCLQTRKQRFQRCIAKTLNRATCRGGFEIIHNYPIRNKHFGQHQ